MQRWMHGGAQIMDKNKPLLLFELSDNNSPLVDTNGNIIPDIDAVIAVVDKLDTETADLVQLVLYQQQAQIEKLIQLLETAEHNVDYTENQLEEVEADAMEHAGQIRERIEHLEVYIDALQDEVSYQARTEQTIAAMAEKELNEKIDTLYNEIKNIADDCHYF